MSVVEILPHDETQATSNDIIYCEMGRDEQWHLLHSISIIQIQQNPNLKSIGKSTML